MGRRRLERNCVKYHVEEETTALRAALEREALAWPGVTHRKMMGCPCYLANGKMFAGLVTKGIFITKLTPGEREGLAEVHPVEPFVWGRGPSRAGPASPSSHGTSRR